MTPEQLRKFIDELGVTQFDFARLVGVDPRTVRKWLSGTSRVPGPVLALVGALRPTRAARSVRPRRGRVL